MDRYHSAKGTLYKIKNVWNIPAKYELQMPNEAKILNLSLIGGAVIITGYTIKETEVTAKTSCINDHRVMYSFGKGFGDITIDCEGLLGNGHEDNELNNFQESLGKIYEAARLNVAGGKPAIFSIAGAKAIEFHVVGLSVGGYIPEIEVLPFSFIGILSK